MHPIVQHLKSILDPYQKLITQEDQNLIKTALSRTFGDVIYGDLGEYEFLRDVDCSGRVNQGKMIQLITDYIIWSYGSPRFLVTEHAFLPNHPFQEFVNNNRELISYVPEVITHYVTSQKWVLSKDGIDEEIVSYIPSYFKQEVDIE